MATLRVTSLRGRTAGTSPELPDGAVVTGVTTTGSAIVGAVLQSMLLVLMLVLVLSLPHHLLDLVKV